MQPDNIEIAINAPITNFIIASGRFSCIPERDFPAQRA